MVKDKSGISGKRKFLTDSPKKSKKSKLITAEKIKDKSVDMIPTHNKSAFSAFSNWIQEDGGATSSPSKEKKLKSGARDKKNSQSDDASDVDELEKQHSKTKKNVRETPKKSKETSIKSVKSEQKKKSIEKRSNLRVSESEKSGSNSSDELAEDINESDNSEGDHSNDEKVKDKKSSARNKIKRKKKMGLKNKKTKNLHSKSKANSVSGNSSSSSSESGDGMVCNMESENSDEELDDVMENDANEFGENDKTNFDEDVTSQKQCSSKGDDRKLSERLYTIGGERVIACLYSCEQIFIQGKAKITCLSGEVNISGFIFNTSSDEYEVFSPNSTSRICILAGSPENSSPDKKCLQTHLNKLEKDGFLSSEVKREIMSNSYEAVMLLKKCESQCCNLLTSFSLYPSLFNVCDNAEENLEWHTCLDKELSITSNESVDNFIISEEQSNAIKRISSLVMNNQPAVILLCGGKNVGKSSMARILINSLLVSKKSVSYLECDLGQTEFTPPGFISLHQITKPVFGPPSTHQRTALRQCFVGAVSPADNPSYYIQCIKFVFEKYTSMRKNSPLIINTMGWNKGLGLVFMSDILGIVTPDVVIQINSSNSVHNYPEINHDFISDISFCEKNDLNFLDSQYENVNDQGMLLNHELIPIPSPVIHRTSTYKPIDHRDMALLSYFSSMFGNKSHDFDFTALVPYCLPLDAVAIHILHMNIPYSHLLYAINASVVALCRADASLINSSLTGMPGYIQENPICECFGLGIVRGIDLDKEVIYILTPLSLSTFSQVNILLKGCLEIPTSIFMNQANLTDSVPYIGESKDVKGAASIKKRRHILRRNATIQKEQ